MPMIIFLFWSIIGYSALSILRTQRNIMQNILLAPTVGIAITLLPVFWLNRAGIPVGNFATTLTIILLITSLLLFLWKKPLFPIKYYLPYVGIFIFALWLTGRPLLKFGFNWVSYANDDMANYCLSALRFLHHGYFDTPNIDDLLSNRDYSQYYWFMHVVNMTRSGADLLLAWLSELTHLTPLQIFMPLIMAFHLALISASAALVYQSRFLRFPALATAFLLACSPLISLGTLYQLIAQVVGISLLIVSTILLLQPFTLHQKYIVFRQSILISIIVSALLICYPEVTPFLFLSVITYFIINLFQGWRPQLNFLLVIVFCIGNLLLSLNTFLINFFIFLEQQASAGLSTTNAEIFPYFLLPTGLSNLWGILPIAASIKEPWQSIAIFVGVMLLVLTIIMAIKQIRKKQFQPVIIMLLIMLGLSLFLFIQNSGFGLFKIAMYMQPFLISTVVIVLFCIFKKNIYKTSLIIFTIILLNTQYHYLKYSYGSIGAPFSELSNASRTYLLDELKILSDSTFQTQTLMIDTHSIVPAKLLALYFSDKKTEFYSNNFFHNIINSYNNNYDFLMKYKPTIGKTADNLSDNISKQYVDLYFSVQDLKYPNLTNHFTKLLETITNDTIAIISTPNRSILNHREFSENTNKNFTALPLNEVSNHLIFINSSLGQDYYHGETTHISLRNFERDYFYSNKHVAGLGQYLLFQIINPTPKVRLALNITKTNSQDKNDLLPSAMIIGENRKPFSVIGRGSARVFSPPIDPQIIADSPYIMIDMGETGKLHHGERSGLMKLYGKKINLDTRLITAYARDISLISEQEYENLSPPSYIIDFPNDLANPDLEYSGIYEDGWVSEAAYFHLMQPNTKVRLLIKGHIPRIKDPITMDLTIYLDDKKIATRKISEGDFTIQIPVTQNSGRRKIELHFSKAQNLPYGDNRLVASKIEFIGFEKIT